MERVTAALREQQAELAGLLSGLQDADWDRPSRCEGWTVSDVVLHLAQTDELATASATGRFSEAVTALTAGAGPARSIDEGADVMVAGQRGRTGAEVRSRWDAGVRALDAALDAADPHQRVTWVAGTLSVRTLAATRLAETWIHTGDVAEALGRELPPTGRLWPIARLAWRTVPYAFSRAGRVLTGPVAFELTGPAGDHWSFGADDGPLTTVRGKAAELCLVAARRIDPAATGLVAEGPDAEGVLALVRTYA